MSQIIEILIDLEVMVESTKKSHKKERTHLSEDLEATTKLADKLEKKANGLNMLVKESHAACNTKSEEISALTDKME